MTDLVTRTPLLRFALLTDSLASGAVGLLLLGGSPWLPTLLGLPEPLLLVSGAICLAWAVVVGWVSSRDHVPARLLWAIIALNGCWVVESLALLVLGWVEPTMLGMTFVIVQAAAVALFAEMQFIGLARARSKGVAAA